MVEEHKGTIEELSVKLAEMMKESAVQDYLDESTS